MSASPRGDDAVLDLAVHLLRRARDPQAPGNFQLGVLVAVRGFVAFHELHQARIGLGRGADGLGARRPRPGSSSCPGRGWPRTGCRLIPAAGSGSPGCPGGPGRPGPAPGRWRTARRAGSPWCRRWGRGSRTSRRARRRPGRCSRRSPFLEGAIALFQVMDDLGEQFPVFRLAQGLRVLFAHDGDAGEMTVQ